MRVPIFSMSEIEKQDMERVRRCLDLLIEHFDSVQIFATRHDPTIVGGTVTLDMGVGNWCTRRGQVRQWIIREDERERIDVRSEEDDIG